MYQLFVTEVVNPGDFSKVATEYDPKIAALIKGIVPSPSYTYVLVNALGASEFWGSNVNGDSFPERGLGHEGNGYGYKTFELYARPFPHHRNKSDEFAFGKVMASVYNTRMHRVELLLQLDVKRARIVGAGYVINRILKGELPDVSMGARVPFDVCSICGPPIETLWELPVQEILRRAYLPNNNPQKFNGIAKRFSDYCEHLKGCIGKIWHDGRIVTAVNMYPKFFDISFVFIGADSTAKVLRKVATAGQPFFMPSAMLAEQFGVYKGQEKRANIGKVAELIKDIPAKDVQVIRGTLSKMDSLTCCEPDINKNTLDNLSSQFPLKTILDSLGYGGVLVKPREFQRMVLVSKGYKDVADVMDSNNVCFDPPARDELPAPTNSSLIPSFDSSILESIKQLLPQRSFFGPALNKRVVVLNIKKVAPPLTKTASSDVPDQYKHILDGFSKMYAQYRSDLIKVAHLESISRRNPYLLGALGVETSDELWKLAAVGVDAKKVPWQALLAIVPLTYLYAAHLKRAGIKNNEELNVIQKFITNNPSFTSATLFNVSKAALRI